MEMERIKNEKIKAIEVLANVYIKSKSKIKTRNYVILEIWSFLKSKQLPIKI